MVIRVVMIVPMGALGGIMALHAEMMTSLVFCSCRRRGLKSCKSGPVAAVISLFIFIFKLYLFMFIIIVVIICFFL